jgi:hypothetical protein
VRGLASAELVELPPGGRLHLRTSAVAMTGSVTAASRPPGRGKEAMVEYRAPSLLPLIHVGGGLAGAAPAFVRLTAGADGASLMVVPGAGAAPVTAPSCVDLPALAAAAARGGGGRPPTQPVGGVAAAPARHRVTRATPMDAPATADLAHEPPRAPRASAASATGERGGGEGAGSAPGPPPAQPVTRPVVE